MALIPSTTYSGQVATTDPGGYPLGKAQDELVSGDGTGTPLEASWINDLWGFLQALLVLGGITATGNPDKVGVSQYCDAIRAAAYTWTGLHIFSNTVRFAAAPLYVAGVSRLSWAAMNGAWAQDGAAPFFDNTQWVSPDVATFVPGTTKTCINFRLPPGAILTKVTGVVSHGGTYNCTMQVAGRFNALSGTNRISIGAAVTITGLAGTQVLPTATLAATAAEVHEYWAEFTFSNVNSHIQGVQIEWTDNNIKNQLR